MKKAKAEGQMSCLARFDKRFLEQYVGKGIMSDPMVAAMELIANCWDANARKIEIWLPNEQTGQGFSIEDDGTGMTNQQFHDRWMKLGYDRRKSQGRWAENPKGANGLPKRRAFGKNGKGRHAAFCFCGDEFFVSTCAGVERITYRIFVPNDESAAFSQEIVSKEKCKETGTKIFSKKPIAISAAAWELRAEIGTRILSNPDFEVYINGEKVCFEDIPQDRMNVRFLESEDVGRIEITTIDAKACDRDTRLHGIAWQVSGRLVGQAGWKNFGDQNFIDGRKAAAKRFSFIVKADCLDDDECENLRADWNGFNHDKPAVKKAFEMVNEFIRDFLMQQSAGERAEVFANIKQQNAPRIRKMGLQNAELWTNFVKKVQEECPRVAEAELESIATILANLEASRSKFALLEKLQAWSPDNLDSLNGIFEAWDIDTAKLVLDELKWRLTLIDDLSEKMLSDKTDELHDLQPIFDKGLWIFGPEFESVHFTSNRSMAKVISDLLKIKDAGGSRRRPDYVVLPDESSSIGFYARPGYDKNYAELGVAALVIVELKKPSVALGDDQKKQCWDYVKELLERGSIQEDTKVDCFLLGRTIEPREEKARTEGSNILIQPVTYDTILTRAKSRTFRLYEKVRNAPFLDQREIEMYLDQPQVINQMTMFPLDSFDASPPVVTQSVNRASLPISNEKPDAF
ncbi:MAG: ATP-binding protein [Candidatus Obscuribacterales bacterium]|nr:ATP-binding protein [Candidatus Obscuribacterales bacterium]